MDQFASTITYLRIALVGASTTGILLARFSIWNWSEAILALIILFSISLSVNSFFLLPGYYRKRLSLGKKVTAGFRYVHVVYFVVDSMLGVTFLVLHIVTAVNSNDWSVKSTVLALYAAFCALGACFGHVAISIMCLHVLLKDWFTSSVVCPSCNRAFDRHVNHGKLSDRQPRFVQGSSSANKETSRVSLCDANEEGMDEGDPLITPSEA